MEYEACVDCNGRHWVVGPADAAPFTDPITAHNVALVMNGGASRKSWNKFVRKSIEKVVL